MRSPDGHQTNGVPLAFRPDLLPLEPYGDCPTEDGQYHWQAGHDDRIRLKLREGHEHVEGRRKELAHKPRVGVQFVAGGLSEPLAVVKHEEIDGEEHPGSESEQHKAPREYAALAESAGESVFDTEEGEEK